MKEYKFSVVTEAGMSHPNCSTIPITSDPGAMCTLLRAFFEKKCVIEFEEVEVGNEPSK
jgi:hypothetical protein